MLRATQDQSRRFTTVASVNRSVLRRERRCPLTWVGCALLAVYGEQRAVVALDEERVGGGLVARQVDEACIQRLCRLTSGRHPWLRRRRADYHGHAAVRDAVPRRYGACGQGVRRRPSARGVCLAAKPIPRLRRPILTKCISGRVPAAAGPYTQQAPWSCDGPSGPLA